MARTLLALLCGIAPVLLLLLLRVAADTARCSRPQDVPNAHIEVGTDMGLHSLLRYSCAVGYKRRAGTSSLIRCVQPDGSARPRWTHPTLQCIRDPALARQTPGPTIPMVPHPESTTPRGTSPTSSPSPAGQPGADGPPLETSRPVEKLPAPDTSTVGEGTTPLPDTPLDSATVSTPALASSIGLLLVLLVMGIVACWRCKMHPRSGYEVTPGDIPMVAPAAGNEEVPPPGIVPVG
ncbi:interleukin-15 receptor subunit alpha isoform X2 [Pithys albifrons albifrons]|uniref:interleukin-15 receptor subunit alpha isoform X2 n=1 Tax=Pithys albifrons albifrons TaxID=3385563 RepID=UPI003A5CC9E7